MNLSFSHPKLVNILLRIFNEWNRTGTQLIATTHDTDILDAPLGRIRSNLVRR